MHFRHLSFCIPYMEDPRVHSGNCKGPNLEGKGILCKKKPKILSNAKLLSIKNKLCII